MSIPAWDFLTLKSPRSAASDCCSAVPSYCCADVSFTAKCRHEQSMEAMNNQLRKVIDWLKTVQIVLP